MADSDRADRPESGPVDQLTSCIRTSIICEKVRVSSYSKTQGPKVL